MLLPVANYMLHKEMMRGPKIDNVYIVLYTSKSSSDDIIENAPETLEGAVEWIRNYIKENYEDWDENSLELRNYAQATKGVVGSIETFNIYKLPLKK